MLLLSILKKELGSDNLNLEVEDKGKYTYFTIYLKSTNRNYQCDFKVTFQYVTEEMKLSDIQDLITSTKKMILPLGKLV